MIGAAVAALTDVCAEFSVKHDQTGVVSRALAGLLRFLKLISTYVIIVTLVTNSCLYSFEDTD